MSVRNTKAITRLMYSLINGDSRAFITEFCWGLDPTFMPGLALGSQGTCLPLMQLLAWLFRTWGPQEKPPEGTPSHRTLFLSSADSHWSQVGKLSLEGSAPRQSHEPRIGSPHLPGLWSRLLQALNKREVGRGTGESVYVWRRGWGVGSGQIPSQPTP